MTTVEMIEYKVLTCSKVPDPQGDIIPPDSIILNGDIKIFRMFPSDKNFVTFAKAKVKDDGLYICAPAPSLAPYNGQYLAPEGNVTKMQQVTYGGKPCRLIHSMVLSGIAIVPKHVDPTILPLRIVIKEVTKRADKKKKVTIKSKKKAGKPLETKPKPKFKRKR